MHLVKEHFEVAVEDVHSTSVHIGEGSDALVVSHHQRSDVASKLLDSNGLGILVTVSR